jgi:DNA (cytosine-5)-methyltransferase 1
MNVIELFCGAGGTSVGFKRAGYTVCAGLDSCKHAVATFRTNFPEAATLESSIQNVSGKQLLASTELQEIDVLLGGPSCQGYSTIGKRIEDDPRNFLFSHYIRCVKELLPTWIVFENVRGMMLYSKGRFIRGLTEELAALGYSCCYDVLNTADYGVPQRRERFFLIGTRHRFIPSFPEATHQDLRCATCSRPDGSNRVRAKVGWRTGELFSNLPCPRCNGSGFEPPHLLRKRPWLTVWDAIGDLAYIKEAGGRWDFQEYDQSAFSAYQKAMRTGSRGYDLHFASPVSGLAKSIISRVQEGSGIRSIPEDELPERFRIMRRIGNGRLRRDCTTLYHRLARNLPSYTITCYFTNVASGAFVHPLSDRALTPREAARLQSFPDSFQFARLHVKSQIGNAVPPLMAEAIARHILWMERVRSDGHPSDPKPKRLQRSRAVS